MLKVGEALRKLEEKLCVNLEDLRNNEEFIDIAMYASQVALRNSQKEKLDALRNAILNSALPSPLDRSMQQIFINFIDVFTAWHLKILHFVRNPEQWAQKYQNTFPSLMLDGLSPIIETIFPDLKGRREFYDQIGKDLASRGLTNTESFHVPGSWSALMEKGTTGLGDKFLKFISDPAE